MSPDEAQRFSHPAGPGGEPVLLRSHLRDVARRVEAVVPAGATLPSGVPFPGVARRVALLHDLGKLTTAFQRHIGTVKGAPSGPTHHAPLGALATHHVLESTGESEETALAGFIAVASHHSRLPNVPDYLSSRVGAGSGTGSTYRDDVPQQVRDIDENVPNLADAIVAEASDTQTGWGAFRKRVLDGSLLETVADLAEPTGGLLDLGDAGLPEDLFDAVLPLWSALLLADKTGAAGTPTSGYVGQRPGENAVTSHISNLQGEAQEADPAVNRINTLRERARQEIVSRAETFAAAETNVATLTLPTGLGKTLSGLQAALRIRDAKGTTGDEAGRVIYALPYTSIVDQVAGVARTVFDADPTGRLLTVHHHLSDTRHALEEAPVDSDASARLETMLGETWRSGLVVTTFVQLLESLIGGGNSQAMKLPALHDAVIVLDEPQALPHSWWLLVRRLSEVLDDRFNADVVAMTATQPHLFTGWDRPTIELVPEPDTYFQELDRVDFRLHGSADPRGTSSPLPHSEAATTVRETLTEENSTLVICNTIDSTREFAAYLREGMETVPVQEVYAAALPFPHGDDTAENLREVADEVERRSRDQDAIPLLQLTTRIRPCDRARLIDLTRELLTRDEITLGVVSTQLVEAGVDVSFETVYRDLAPMDSIVQAAGRCNRSSGGPKGEVTVWKLAPPGDKEMAPSEAVYARWGENLLAHTANALREVRGPDDPLLPEERVTRVAVEAYYDSLDTARPGDPEMVEEVDDARFRDLSRRSLIDERGSVEVIVARTPSDRTLVQEIREHLSNDDYDEARPLLEEARELQVSIPIYEPSSDEAHRLSTLEPLHHDIDETLRVLDTQQPRFEGFLNAVTAEVVVPDQTVEARFL